MGDEPAMNGGGVDASGMTDPANFGWARNGGGVGASGIFSSLVVAIFFVGGGDEGMMTEGVGVTSSFDSGISTISGSSVDNFLIGFGGIGGGGAFLPTDAKSPWTIPPSELAKDVGEEIDEEGGREGGGGAVLANVMGSRFALDLSLVFSDLRERISSSFFFSASIV